MPTPYRSPVFDRLATIPGLELMVVYLSAREPNRLWSDIPIRHSALHLSPRLISLPGDRYIHVHPELFPLLARLRPDVVVTNGYNISDLFGIFYTIFYRKRHVSQTDGSLESERRLSRLHRIVRRAVQHVTHAYVGPSASSAEAFRSFGAPPAKVFIAPLSVDNSAFASDTSREVDLLFVGRLTPDKNPGFVLEFATALHQRLRRPVSVTMVGDGDLRGMLERDRASGVEVTFTGFVQQAELPRVFARARLFVMPSRWEPWGVVLNEACAAGLPVIVSEHVGAAAELIESGVNGWVLPLDVEKWADYAEHVLTDEALAARLGAASQRIVDPYTFDAAAHGYLQAFGYEEPATGGTP